MIISTVPWFTWTQDYIYIASNVAIYALLWLSYHSSQESITEASIISYQVNNMQPKNSEGLKKP